MSHSKRRWEEIDDFQEEEPAYGKQILPVANLPQDFNAEPMDGMQYLFMVRRDARQLPSTFRAPNPFEKPQELSTASEFTNTQSSNTISQLPTEKWRRVFERHFQNFRKNFEQPTTYVGPMNLPQGVCIPRRHDRDLWWLFLSGRPSSEWILNKKSKNKRRRWCRGSSYSWIDEPSNTDNTTPPATSSWNNDEGEVEEVLRIDPAETLPSPAGTPVPLDYLEALSQSSSTPIDVLPSLLEEDTPPPREPTPQFLKSIDERTAMQILMYFTYWINLHCDCPESSTCVPTDLHGRWIFFLLSRIDDFISPNDMSLLRNLARACISMLKYVKTLEITDDSSTPDVSAPIPMSETSCWVIITIVAEFWKQRDLWMDAEDALKST